MARGWWFPERHAATIALHAEREEQGHHYCVLEVTPEGGRAFLATVDAGTKLLTRTEEQQAEDLVVSDYADYREVAGVLLPFSVRRGDGTHPDFDTVIAVTAIEANHPPADEFYTLPPRPAPDIELPPGADSVQVPLRLTADHRVLVPVGIGGHTFEAEFDSGGNLIVQPASVALLDLPVRGGSRISGGGEGVAAAGNGRLATLTLGQAQVHDLAFHSYAFAPQQPQRVLLGLELLQRFVIRLDFDRGLMTLTRPERFSYHGDGTIVPFHFQDNQPEIKGSIDGIAGLFTVDTGDSSSLLLIAPFARRYDLVARYRADVPYSGTSVSATRGVWARRRVQALSFDGADGRAIVTVHQPVTRISLQTGGFDANRNVSGNIGIGVLQQFNLTFDYPQQRLIFEPNRRFGQPDVFNRTGLRLQRADSHWEVSAVYPGGAAAAAGVRVGDRVTRIDGETPATLDAEGLAAKMVGPVGQRLQLLVQAGGRERHLTLTLADLL